MVHCITKTNVCNIIHVPQAIANYRYALQNNNTFSFTHSVFLKSASIISFTDKNFKCLTEIKILSVRMSDTKFQDVLLYRTRTSLTEKYPVWHDVSFCQTECLTSLKSFQEVCALRKNVRGENTTLRFENQHWVKN